MPLTKRITTIDATRVLFLVLGVVYHSTLPYAIGHSWRVRSPQQLVGASSIVDWLHTFRMQGFFLMSGIVSWHQLSRQSAAEFSLVRLRRLGVPFLTVLALIQPLELAVSRRFDPVVSAAAVNGVRVGHLWFLAYLALFSAALAVIARLMPRLRSTSHAPLRVTDIGLVAGLLAAGFTIRAVGVTNPEWWSSEHLGFLFPAEFLSYGVFFGLGIVVARGESESTLWSRPSWWLWVAAIGVGGALHVIGAAPFHGAWTASVILGQAYPILVVRLLMFGLSRLGPAASMLRIPDLAESSYTVYLLHHVLVVVVATLLLAVDWHPVLKILVTASVASIVPFVFHRHVVRRFAWVAFLLNGAWSPRGQQEPTARAVDRMGA